LKRKYRGKEAVRLGVRVARRECRTRVQRVEGRCRVTRKDTREGAVGGDSALRP